MKSKLIGITDKLKKTEPALVTAMFDGGRFLFFIGLTFVVLGPVIEAFRAFMMSSFLVGSGLYTQTDIDFVNTLYGYFKYSPILGIICLAIFFINYSNILGGDGGNQ